MKIYYTLSLLFLMISCTKQDTKRVEIYNFLNNTAKHFDNKKYELVSLDLLDTVFVTNYNNLEYFTKYKVVENPNITTTSDTIVYVEPPNFTLEDINWIYRPFSKSLHDYIKRDDNNYLLQDNSPNSFMNKIVQSDYNKFKENLFNAKFQKELFKNLNEYEGFSAIAVADTFVKYINLEKMKDKEIVAYRYLAKYRIDNTLNRTQFLFNSSGKILEYKFIED